MITKLRDSFCFDNIEMGILKYIPSGNFICLIQSVFTWLRIRLDARINSSGK